LDGSFAGQLARLRQVAGQALGHSPKWRVEGAQPVRFIAKPDEVQTKALALISEAVAKK
jgi:hypothetical protein